MIAKKELVQFHEQSIDIMKIVVQTQIGKKSFMLGKIHGHKENSKQETTQVKQCHQMKMYLPIFNEVMLGL